MHTSRLQTPSPAPNLRTAPHLARLAAALARLAAALATAAWASLAAPAQQVGTPPAAPPPLTATAAPPPLTATTATAQAQAATWPQQNEAFSTTPPLPLSARETSAGAAPTPVFASKEAEGDALNLHGHYLAAIHAFQAVQPPTPVLLNKIGVATEHMYMYPQARASFEQAIKLRPDYPEAWNNLGTVFHAQADYRHAEKCYRKSLKLRATSADVLQNLGTLYYARHDYKKGDAAYKQAIALDPQVMERSAHNGIQSAGTARNRAEMHFHLACTYAEAGQHELALDYLRKCILEGFHDRDRMLHEKQLADLRTMEPFLKMADDLKKN